MVEMADHFDSAHAAVYDDRARKIVPGYETLQGMADLILAAELGETASILVVGAGTGQELLFMAKAHPGWRFTAVDPSQPMLALAQEKFARAGASDRVTWHQGPLEELSGDDLFDAATLLMVLHHVPVEGQYTLLLDLADRLMRGAPFLIADVFGDPGTTRYKRMDALTKAWAVASGLDPKEAQDVFATSGRTDMHLFTEERMKGWLKEAGFIDVQRFYQAFSIGAWLARTNR